MAHPITVKRIGGGHSIKTTILLICLKASFKTQLDLQGKDRRLHILSQCLSLAELSPAVSLYAPLTAPQSLPRASYPWSSLWHTSAVCAAFLDSATLPMRLSPQNAGSCDLHSLSSLLVRFSFEVPLKDLRAIENAFGSKSDACSGLSP